MKSIADQIIENDNGLFTGSELHDNTGRIELQTMVYRSWDNHISCSLRVRIQSQKHGHTEGFGTTIFDGTLDELIAKLAPLPEVHETPLEAAPELSVKG